MSFSICARVGEAYGVAVAGRVLATGTLAAAARPGVGAVCVLASPTTTREALLDRIEHGLSARQALDEVAAGNDRGQMGLVGRHEAAVHTGHLTGPERGERVGGDEGCGYAITGHLLVSERVLDAMERAFVDSPHLPIVERLVASLAAGDAAGGDVRGRQSASVLAVEHGAGIDGSSRLADLRVDDHEHPVAELSRLVALSDLYYGPVLQVLPLEGVLRDEVTTRLGRLGYTGDDLGASLTAWATPANLRRRLTSEGIDARLLQVLREATVVRAQDALDNFPSF